MFLNTYQPDPILLEIGFIQIHWYGFLIALAGALGFFVFYKLAKHAGFKKNFIFDLVFWLIIWGLIGARIYHVLSEIGYYSKNLLEIFYIWNGGLGIYGAIIAGIMVVWHFSKKQNKIFYKLLNLLVPALTLGQAIGRWGNYFNQELYGLPSNLPWAIPIDLANRLPGFENFTYFHPVFLYESLACFGIFLILFCRNVALPCSNEAMPRFYSPGTIFLLYIFLYSTWRFFIEFLRIDPQPILLNLRLTQWTSLFFIILAIIFFFVLRRRNKNAIIKSEN